MMATDLISRQDAKAKGLLRYFTGQACTYGHIAERQVSNGICLKCRKDIEKRHREAHPEKFRTKWRNYERNASLERKEQKRLANKKYGNSHKKEASARSRKWEKDNPERRREIDKKWRDDNPQKIREKNRNYKTKHAERLAPIAIERTLQWRTNNPEKVLENGRKGSHVRRARKYKSGGSYTNDQIRELLKQQDWTCIYCSSSLREKRELDHIMPLARGGSNDIANLQWLCSPCNRKKRDRDPVEFAASILVTKNRPSLC
jgi:hypothetical protein